MYSGTYASQSFRSISSSLPTSNHSIEAGTTAKVNQAKSERWRYAECQTRYFAMVALPER